MSGKKDIQEKESEVEVEYTNKPEGDYSQFETNNNVGGYYPFGENGFWHSGVHVEGAEIKGIGKKDEERSEDEKATFTDEKNAVKPILNGKIVACRINSQYKKIPLEDIIKSKEFNQLLQKYQNFYKYDKKKNRYLLKNSSEENEIISNNFYLIEHEVENGLIKFYTLYYNLLCDKQRLNGYLEYKNDQNYKENLYKQIKPFYKTYSIKVKPDKSCEVKYVKGTDLVLGSIVKSNYEIDAKDFDEKIKQSDLFELKDCNTNVTTDLNLAKLPYEPRIKCDDISSEFVDIDTVYITEPELIRREDNKIYGGPGFYNVTKVGVFKDNNNPDVKNYIADGFSLKEYIDGPSIKTDNSCINLYDDFIKPTYLIPMDYVELNQDKNLGGSYIYQRRYPIKGYSGRDVFRIGQNVKEQINESNRPLHYVDITETVSRNIKNIAFILTEKEIADLYKNDLRKINFIYDENNLLKDFTFIEATVNDKSEDIYSNEKYCICYYPNIDDVSKNKIKIFWDGVEVTPLTLNNNEFSKLIIGNIELNKDLSKPFVNDKLLVFEVEPTVINNLDCFMEFNKTQYGNKLIKVKTKSKYYLCNRCIQPQVMINYDVNKESLKIKGLCGTVKTELKEENIDIKKGCLCYRSSPDKKSTPLYVLKKETEFVYDTKPEKTTIKKESVSETDENSQIDIYHFKNFIFNKTMCSSDIPESCISIKIINNTKIVDNIIQNVDNDQINYLKDGYPVTPNTILGQAFYDFKFDNYYSYYDVCMFMDKKLPDKKYFNQKYLFYKKNNKSNLIYEDTNQEIIFHLPLGTQVEFNEKNISANSRYVMMSIKKIPVFINEDQYLECNFIGDKKLIDIPGYFLLNKTKVLQNKNNDKCIDYMSKLFYFNYKNFKDKNLNVFDYRNNDIGVFLDAKYIGMSQIYYCFSNNFAENIAKDIIVTLQKDYQKIQFFDNNPMISNLNNSISLFLPEKTVIECFDIFNYSNIKVYKIKIKKIPVFINKKYFKKTYRLKNTNPNIYLGQTKLEDYSNNKKYKKFYDAFINFKINTVNIYDEYISKEANGNAFAGIYIDSSTLMFNKSFWIDRQFAMNNFVSLNASDSMVINSSMKLQKTVCKPKSALKSVLLYEKDPDYLYCSGKALQEDVEITRIDTRNVIKSNSYIQYYSATIKDDSQKYYIKKDDLSKFADDATEWNKYFNDIGEDKDIISGTVKDVQDKLGLTDSEVKRCKDYESISDIYNASGENENVIKQFRTIIIKHPHEWDQKGYEKLSDSKPKILYAKNYSIKAEIVNQLNDLGFNSDKLMTYFHPFYFLNHLNAAGMLEFNPYEGKTGTDLNGNAWGPDNDNPGFAPYDPNIFGNKYEGYADINLIFNVPSTSHNHAGLDFNGAHDFTTPVKSLINAHVIATGLNHEDWGNYILCQNNERKDYFYILAHLYRIDVQAEMDVTPGTNMGIVGNTGNCWSQCGIQNGPSIRVDTNPDALAAGWGTHLHLQLVNKSVVSQVYDFIGKRLQKDLNKDSYNPIKHSELFK